MKFSKRHNTDTDSDNQANQDDQSLDYRQTASSHSAPDDFTVSLRADMLPASNIKPELRRFRSFRLLFFILRAILILSIIIGIGWLLYFGPGRPVIENMLHNLNQRIQPGSLVSPAVPSTTPDNLEPTATHHPQHTRTPTPLPIPSATAMIIQPTQTPNSTPTEESGCVDVLGVTLQDVGKILCIRGIILNYEERPSGFLIAFSTQKGAMYWVSYDLIWEPAKEGLCVENTGEVMQIANSPVLVFGFQNPPQICNNP